MVLELYANGGFQAMQQSGFYTFQAAGQWSFNPGNQLLQLQGLVQGFQPFMMGIMIQGQQGNTYYGTGMDGLSYVLARA